MKWHINIHCTFHVVMVMHPIPLHSEDIGCEGEREGGRKKGREQGDRQKIGVGEREGRGERRGRDKRIEDRRTGIGDGCQHALSHTCTVQSHTCTLYSTCVYAREDEDIQPRHLQAGPQ